MGKFAKMINQQLTIGTEFVFILEIVTSNAIPNNHINMSQTDGKS